VKGLVILLIVVVAVLLLTRARNGKKDGAGASRGRLGAGLLLLLVGLLATRSWVEVPPAAVAAVYDPLRGGILASDLGEGWHVVPPWASVRLFSTRTQNYTMGSMAQETGGITEDAIQCQTSEGLSVSLDCTLLFHIAPGDANKVWRAVGADYVGVVVRPNAREAARVIISEYPIMAVYSNAPPSTDGIAGVDFYPGKRQEVADKIHDRLVERLKGKGVTLERFLLRNVDYLQPPFEKSIVDKQVAQQRVVTQQYEAEIQRIRAKANIVRAEGDAEAIRLKASAIRVQPKVIEWEMVQRLPDDLEVVILPGQSMPLINLGSPSESPATQPQQQAPQPGMPPRMMVPPGEPGG
jgi:regulator of protease activity HflC (stomatin/prohibitin superfamily)